MAGRRPPAPPSPPARLELTTPRDEAEGRLREQITKAIDLRSRSVQTQDELVALKRDCRKWQDYTEHLLLTIFTTQELKREFSNAGLQNMVVMGHYSSRDELHDLLKKIDDKRAAWNPSSTVWS
jgi:hypothetical protein